MAKAFTRSNKADLDINKITKWSLSNFGRNQTLLYMAGMDAHFQTLAENPNIGRTYLNYFYSRYESHVIYYRQRKNDILIARILHKSKLPKKHIKR